MNDATKNPYDDPNYGSDLVSDDSAAPVKSGSANPYDDPNYGKEPESRGVTGIAKDLGTWTAKGVVAVPEAAVGIGSMVTGGRVGKAAADVGFTPDKWKESMNEWHTDATKAAQKEFEDAEGVWGKTKAAIQNPSNVVGAVVESLPSMAAGGMAGRGLLAASRGAGIVANPANVAKGASVAAKEAAVKQAQNQAAMAGAAGEGVMMAGSQAEAIRQETEDGLLTPGQALAAAGTGALGMGFSALGGKLANRLGVGDAETMLVQGQKGIRKQIADSTATAAVKAAGNPLAEKEVLKGIPRQMIEGAMVEGLLEELPQSVSEQIIQNLALDKDWHDEVDSAIVLGTLSGGAMGAGAAGYKGLLTPSQKAGDAATPAAPAGTPEAPLQIGYNPDPLLGFPDGSVGTRAQADAYINSLPEGERLAARARMMNLGAAPAQSISEAAGINPANGALSKAIAPAVDAGDVPIPGITEPVLGVDSAMLPPLDVDAPLVAYDDLADADRALYDQHFDDAEAMQAFSSYEDDYLPGFDDPIFSNASDEDFLRATGATDEEIADALSITDRSSAAQGSYAGDVESEENVATSASAGLGQNESTQESVTQQGQTDAPEANQAIQGSAQQAQTTGAQSPTADASQSGQSQISDGSRPAARLDQGGLTNGSSTTVNDGPQGGAQVAQESQNGSAAQSPTVAEETKQQRAKRVTDAGAQWAQMSQDERTTALAGVPSANPIVKKNAPRANWNDLNPALQSSIADAVNPRSVQSQEQQDFDAWTKQVSTQWDFERRAMLAGERQEIDAAIKAGVLSNAEAKELVLRASNSGDVMDFVETIMNGIDDATARWEGSQIAASAPPAIDDAQSKATDAARAAIRAGKSDADAGRAATDSLIASMAEDPSIQIASATPAAVKAAKAIPSEGEDIGGGWRKFSPESGTINVPRAEMPQIKAEHRGAMVNFMNARGIKHAESVVPAASLKPTQSEFSVDKVAKAKGYAGGDRAILVSSDGHVLDGHHQWLSAREQGEDVREIRLDAPIQELLQAARDFPSSTQAQGAPAASTETMQPAAQQKPAKLPYVTKAEADHLFGIDKKREKALARVESEKGAFFMSESKAKDFIKDNGLGDTHEVVQQNRAFHIKAKADAAPKTAASTSTAPEHAQVGVDDRELSEIVGEFNDMQQSMIEDGEVMHHLFDAPAKQEVVRLEDKSKVYHKEHGWMTPAEAKIRIQEWKAHASAQADSDAGAENRRKVVLSLFDKSGAWSQPWEDAGYQVWRFDIQNDPEMGDVNNFSIGFFDDWFGQFDGDDVYAILAANPCTDFASSGSRHFAAKDADGRTVASVKLVHQTLATIEYFKPAVWAIENPVGRIEKLGGLPPWRLAFNPNHLGDPYTKKTLIWGRFNGDLPIAPVEPTEGSKMHTKYGGKSLATKNARSVTPEGFAYGFFMANNAIDNPVMAIANKFDRLDRALIKQAVDAGVTEAQITEAVEDFYYMDLDDDAANAAIKDLIPEAPSAPTGGGTPRGDSPAPSAGGPGKADNGPSLYTHIRAIGGISSEDAYEITGERKAGNRRGFGVGVFTKSGQRLSTLVENGRFDEFLPDELTSRVFNLPNAPVDGGIVRDAREWVVDAISSGNAGQTYHQSVMQRLQAEADAEPLLTSPTPAQVVAQQDAKEAASASQAKADAAAAQSARDEANRKEIAARSEAAADTFVLGGDAMANLTGQESIFDAPAAPAKADKKPSKNEINKAKVDAVSARYLNGAKEGDTITLSKDFDYATGGKPYLIESITPRGDVHILDQASGGKTSFKADVAFGSRVKFEVATPAQATGADKDGNTIIGRRADGVMIRQDKNGVRFYTDRGVQISETVGLRPTRQGMAVDRKELTPEFMTSEESASASAEDATIATAQQKEANAKKAAKPNADQVRAKADLMSALADLGDILGKGTRLNMMPEQEQKLLPVLTRVLDAAFRLGYHKFKDSTKFALDQIREHIGTEAADALTLDHLQGAYIAMAGGKKGTDTKRAVIDVESKADIEAHEAAPNGLQDDDAPAPQAQATAAPSAPAKTLTESLYQAIKADSMPKDNPALKRLTEAFDGAPADPARMKQAQEELETAIVMASRDVVAETKGGDRATFDALLAMYQSQPNLNIRTSTSVANQAYSTPAPLAYLASRLAGVTQSTVVQEPTAGTGMLLIGADPKKAIVNELNDLRIGALEAQGFEPTQRDAATMALVPEGVRPDAVVTNPPFGSIKGADGKTAKVKVDGYNIGQIDHLIAARALQNMKDDGRATLILGANKVAGGMSADDRIFFNWLYSHYNVAGHFEVEGDLYQRQGAGWPVRVITINGRQESSLLAPKEGTIQRVNTWDKVYDHFAKNLDTASAKAARPAADAGAGTAGASAPAGQPRPVPSAGRAANVAGAPAGNVRDSAKQPTVPVATADSEQRLNAQSSEPIPRDGQGNAEAGRSDGNSGNAAVKAKPEKTKGNEFQAPYTPRSSRKDEGVLIPFNMAGPTQDALNRLEDQVGSIDEFARKELGYGSVAELHDALMGLQVDSVAMAIHQIKEGKAVIIADQTGIGKGRQAAAIIRWTARNGMTPVFVSVKPSLFTDMYGDLADIGTTDISPFIMNGDQWIAGADGEKLFANKANKHGAALASIAESGLLPDGRNALFMTYSQINKDNKQRAALRALASNSVFILDESHNAAGESATGEFMISVLDESRGVTYLSATYAKRPDNMPLYGKTDIGDATADSSSLGEAMAAGGLPLQTVVSNNLVKAGQMFRRERSYDGVNIISAVDTENRAHHEKMSDAATEALRAIVQADSTFHDVFVKEMDKEAQKQGGAIQDNAGNQASAGVNHTEFSSVVHNFVKQMLLGLKAQTAANEAIAALKQGKKPIIAVENTMGSFLAEYVAQNGIQQGDALGSFDYRTVLSRALERTRAVTVVSPYGDKRVQQIALSQLDAITRNRYEAAQRVIDGLKIDIPVSPIDWMRSEIKRAGYTVAEITGRSLSVDYTDKKRPVLSVLDADEQKDKVATTRKFNSANMDALILNVAGSTGISLHASERFADQRQRKMIVAQAAGDINIFMQMLGRIHRTGQVQLPEYTLLSVDLPTEKRPTAVLSGKMKSLNANTSSNTESATSVKTADMLNKYGDQIVNQFLSDNRELARQIGVEDILSDDGAAEDLARKATGRLALQPIEVQNAFYEEVEGQYQALIEYLNKTNQNDLEPRTFDFDAQELRTEVLFDGPNKETPFGEDAIYGEYSIKAQGVAMKPQEINATIAESLAGKTPEQSVKAMEESLLDGYAKQINAAIAKTTSGGKLDQIKLGSIMKSLYGDAGETRTQSAIANVASGKPIAPITATDLRYATGVPEATAFLRSHPIGSTFRVDINSDAYNAVVMNVRSTHKESGNPFSMSKIQLTVAVNGSLRSITVPATQFRKIEVSTIARTFTVDTLFREQPANQRETAKIITGNLLAAYGELNGVRGTIISFTKADGTTEQGILLPKLFDYGQNTRGDYRLRSGADAYRFLTTSLNNDIGKIGIATRDSQVRILPKGAGIEIRVPATKTRGAKYFLDKNLLSVVGDFTSSGGAMVARVSGPDKSAEAINLLMEKQALYTLPSMAGEAKAMFADGSTAPADTSFAAKTKGAVGRLDRGTPFDRAVMSMANEGRPANEVLAMIAQGSRNPRYRKLAKLLAKTSVSPKLEFMDKIVDGSIGIYSAKENKIGLTHRAESRAERIFMHEYVHAATVHALHANGLASQQMKKLFEHVKKVQGTGGHYGMTKVEEFVSEAFTNPEFQQFLKSVQAPSGGGTIKTAWDSFIRILKAVFGVDPQSSDAFAKVIETGVVLMREDMRLRGHLERLQRQRAMQGPVENFLQDGTHDFLGTESTPEVISWAMAKFGDRIAPNGKPVWQNFANWFGDSKEVDAQGRPLPSAQSIYSEQQGSIDDVSAFKDSIEDAYFNADGIASLKKSALDQINASFGHEGKVGIWSKTVGTMRDLGERAPAFKPVFEAAQRFIDDVSMFSNDAANAAPRLIPRVENWRDLGKKPITAQDNKAVANALFGGTLMWTRDLDGKAVQVDDMAARYKALSSDEKAQMLLRADKLDPDVLKMWRGQPKDRYDSAVESRFESQMLKGGIVWTDAELKDQFKMSDGQISLYREARAAIDRSIDMTARADMLRAAGPEFDAAREVVLDAATLDDALSAMTKLLHDEALANPEQSTKLLAAHDAAVDRATRARELMDAGYAPLTRFGKYTVDVVDAKGERQYFGMYETKQESNIALRDMKAAFPDATVTQGTMSQQAFKLFAGITPESLELFGNMLGLGTEGNDAQDKVFQEYLKLTKNNHSAMKRLIHRKGVAGYSDDVGRVLASFIYANARQSSSGLNNGRIDGYVNDIPKEQGELKDLAIGLRSYIRDPQEEGQAVRGMLFAQYLGGSVASAFVNMTQPFAVTMPWLSQFGGMKNASAQMARALKDMAGKGNYESDLAAALKRAEDDGTLSPQEIHQLMAQARGGSGALRAGDGSKLGNAKATASNSWERVKVGWGQPFALAEQFNRRSTFIASYRIAKQQGMADPAEFARRAVLETQFMYTKANKPRWARGAIGGTLMTFKTYSISYLELLNRTWTQGGVEGKKAVGWSMAMLMLMGGAGGLPFMEDVEDLIDGIGQIMGYNISSKRWRTEALESVVGKGMTDFIDKGISGLPGSPVDVSGRLGMGNLIPATGLFLEKQSRERDLLELVGPAGDMISRFFGAGRMVLKGDVGGAAMQVSPTAVRNAAKGVDMAITGMYKDTKGYKVIDTTLAEAASKFFGFQPNTVAEAQDATSFILRSRSFYATNKSEITAQWADALFRKDEAAVVAVRERLAKWNSSNPDQRMTIRMPDVFKRVRQMNENRQERIVSNTPKALRQQMNEFAKNQNV